MIVHNRSPYECDRLATEALQVAADRRAVYREGPNPLRAEELRLLLVKLGKELGELINEKCDLERNALAVQTQINEVNREYQKVDREWHAITGRLVEV